jgi:hypothetical protein
MGFGYLEVVELFDENFDTAVAAVGFNKLAGSMAEKQTKRDLIALHGRQVGMKAWNDMHSDITRGMFDGQKQGRTKDQNRRSRSGLRNDAHLALVRAEYQQSPETRCREFNSCVCGNPDCVFEPFDLARYIAGPDSKIAS